MHLYGFLLKSGDLYSFSHYKHSRAACMYRPRGAQKCLKDIMFGHPEDVLRKVRINCFVLFFLIIFYVCL